MGASDSKLQCSEKGTNIRKNPCVNQIKDQLYLGRKKTGDVTFFFESERICAHACILAALSPKYKAQFYGSMPQKEIPMKDVSAAAFKEFLQFFYLEKVELSMDNIAEVLDLAKLSLVDDLVMECANFLIDMVTVDKICWCYQLAISYKIKTLQDFCEEKISVNASSIFTNSDFLECDRIVLCHILKLDALCCKETEVFEACIAWARAACKRKNVNTENAANLRAQLGNAVAEIRFRSMTIEEFAALHKLHDGFFSPLESNEIIYMFGKVDGLKSQHFNHQVRDSAELASIKPRYGVLRMNSQILCLSATGCVSRPPNNTETITFTCNKTIYLKGFTISINLNMESSQKDDIVEISPGEGQLRYTEIYRIGKKGQRSAIDRIIDFELPIEIEAYKRYSIVVKSRSLDLEQDAYALKKEYSVEDGIVFKFPGAKSTLFSELLFNQKPI